MYPHFLVIKSTKKWIKNRRIRNKSPSNNCHENYFYSLVCWCYMGDVIDFCVFYSPMVQLECNRKTSQHKWHFWNLPLAMKLSQHSDPVWSLFCYSAKHKMWNFLVTHCKSKEFFFFFLAVYIMYPRINWYIPLRICCCWSALCIYVSPSAIAKGFEVLLNWLFCALLSWSFVNNGILVM